MYSETFKMQCNLSFFNRSIKTHAGQRCEESFVSILICSSDGFGILWHSDTARLCVPFTTPFYIQV